MNVISSRNLLKGSNSSNTQTTWWTKIYTTSPFCIYYFGPFDRISEAEMSRFGYIQDLEDEGAKVVFTTLTQHFPEDLTLEFKNLSHVKWLHELMQDSLMIKLPALPEISSSKQAAYI